MDERISEILANYRNTVKPLLADIQARRSDGKLPSNFLNEIRALNDHIARCYRDGINDCDIESELTKAEGHLRRLVYDCFKQLNIYINDTLERKEKKYYSDLWLIHNGGTFWTNYSKCRKYAQQNVIEAKKSESINADQAMSYYEKAFQNYRKAEDLLINNKALMRRSRLKKHINKIRHFGWWFIVTLLLSILSSIIGILW